jgi:hypothetical protein
MGRNESPLDGALVLLMLAVNLGLTYGAMLLPKHLAFCSAGPDRMLWAASRLCFWLHGRFSSCWMGYTKPHCRKTVPLDTAYGLP